MCVFRVYGNLLGFVQAEREDQVFACLIERERLSQLLNHPSGVRVGSDVEVQYPAAFVMNDEKHVEVPEGDRRHREEVHRGNAFRMEFQER
jgi:hypothetical protein